MRIEDFDFTLPNELIALRPSEQRDQSRLMVLFRDREIHHRLFRDLPEYLREGDLLVLNNTKVIPARVVGRKPTGGKLDILIVKETGPQEFEILSRGGYSGRVYFEDGLEAEVHEGRKAVFNTTNLWEYLQRHGLMPLPPYIKREPCPEDRQWYQTVYADREGSIAAPTAGLHFTQALLEKLRQKGVLIRFLTLHVGVGTFMPVKCSDVRDHRMAEEYFEVPQELLGLISQTKSSGRRVVAVGTTVTRALEAVYTGLYRQIRSVNGAIRGYTDLFIYPGYRFKAIDALITNFHLPRSTPLLMVSALVGRQRLLNAYREAIRKGYRFFSYGDGMLVL